MAVNKQFIIFWRVLSRAFNILGVGFVVVLFYSCSHHLGKPTSTEKTLLQTALKGLSSEYSHPRLVSGKLVLNIASIELTPSKISNTTKSNSEGYLELLPYMGIWSAGIRDFPTQRLLEASLIFPQPDTLFTDTEYGNTILFWDLSDQIGQIQELNITRTFRYITYDYRPLVDNQSEREQWSEIPQEILNKYTRTEHFLEQDEALVDTVFSLLVDLTDPVSQAHAIYDWVRTNMNYVYPPEERGVRNAFKTGKGDCGQYSALFITMARIAGIPARQQSGFNFVPGNTGAHVWSEIYLPVKGWVPVDATREDGFLHLDNRRLIISTGLNIPLVRTPPWAAFSNSEVENGRTDFMQHFTLVSRGVQAEYTTKRKVLRSVEL